MDEINPGMKKAKLVDPFRFNTKANHPLVGSGTTAAGREGSPSSDGAWGVRDDSSLELVQ